MQDSVEKIKSLCSNAGTSLKDFFEKIEINSIIGQSLHTNPSTDLKIDINSFLQNVEMGEDLKTIKLKMDSAMTKQSEELASQIKKQSKGLSQQFQKYMILLKNQDSKFQFQSNLSGSGRESQISSGSNSQYQHSSKKKRKYEKLAEKHSSRFMRNPTYLIPTHIKPISIMDSSETNSQKQNLDHAVLMSTPSQEHHLNNNYCLSFQDKKAFLNGPLSSSRGSERKMNEFNLSDYIAQSSQSATQSKKGSVKKYNSTLNHKQNNYQHTFGKPQIEISMECEDEDFSSQQPSQRLNYNQQKRVKGNKRFTIEDEESSKHATQSPHSSKQVASLNREEEEFEDEDEPYEEDMIGRSDDSRYYDDDDYEEEENNDDDNNEGEEECDQEYNQQIQQNQQQQQQQIQQQQQFQQQQQIQYQQNNNYKNQMRQQINSNRKSSQQNQSNGVMSENSKVEYSSSKKTQQTGEEIMSFQMPIRNDLSQSQDRVNFDLQFNQNQNQQGNNLFNSIEKQRPLHNSPHTNQVSHLNGESPTFQRNLSENSKAQNRGEYQQTDGKLTSNGTINSNGSNQQQSIEQELNKSNSPKSKQASTKATSCNNLSPSKSRSHSPNIHILDNSPTRPMTRSSAKKMLSKESEINSEQQREEQKRGDNIESYSSNQEQQQQQQQQQQFYNDQMMYQEQSVQIIDIQQSGSRTSQSKDQQNTLSGMKSPSASAQMHSNSGSKNKTRKMKRSSGSRIHDTIDQMKIEHNSQQSLNNPSAQKQ